MTGYYDYVDGRINSTLGIDIGFGGLLAAGPHRLAPAAIDGPAAAGDREIALDWRPGALLAGPETTAGRGG